jgi:beta-glucosidase-like glycosyl hydrolase
MHWAFSPILGIATQPAWPRVYETFGEDPLLAGELGAALISGLQGAGPSLCSPARVAACMKHFVGYPNPRSGHGTRRCRRCAAMQKLRIVTSGLGTARQGNGP